MNCSIYCMLLGRNPQHSNPTVCGVVSRDGSVPPQHSTARGRAMGAVAAVRAWLCQGWPRAGSSG